jgi:Dockerin type I domain
MFRIIISAVPTCTLGLGLIGSGSDFDYFWAFPQSGNWSDAELWEGAGEYPQLPTDTAEITVAGNYFIDVDEDIEISAMSITNPGTDLRIFDRAEHRVLDTLHNDGKITINPLANPDPATLRLGPSMVVTGSGVIELNALIENTDAKIQSLGGMITLDQDITVQGAGTLLGDYMNHGTIQSTNPNELGLVFNKVVTQSATGSILMDGNQLTLQDAAAVTGGLLALVNGGSLLIEDSATVSANNYMFDSSSVIRFQGTCEYPFGTSVPTQIEVLADQTSLSIRNDLINNSSISISTMPGLGISKLLVEDDCTLSGSGEIRITSTQANVNSAGIDVISDATLSVGKNQLIHGSGLIDSSDSNSLVVSNGIIRADSSDVSLNLTGDFEGGVYQAFGGNLIVSRGKISNGTFESNSSDNLILAGENARFENAVFLSELAVRSEIYVSGFIQNNAKITLDVNSTYSDPEITFEDAADLQGVGCIELISSLFEAPSPTLRGSFSLHFPQEIYGAGTLSGQVVSNSVVRATNMDIPLRLIGTFTGGRYIAENSSTIFIQGTHTGGHYESANGRFELADANLSDSTFELSGNGHVRLAPDRDLSLERLELNANLDVCLESIVELNSDVVLSGDHLILDNGIIQLNGHPVIGEGSVVMRTRDTLSPTLLAVDGPGGFGPDYIIEGSGEIISALDGSLVNDNIIRANDPFAPLVIRAHISGIGRIIAENTEIQLNDGTTIQGGILEAIDGGHFTVGEGTAVFQDVQSSVNIRVPDFEHTLDLDGNFVNNGTIMIDANVEDGGGLVIGRNNMLISGNGVIELVESPHTFFSRIRGMDDGMIIGEGQTIRGSGAISQSVTLKGALEPGGSSRTVHTDELVFAPEAQLILDIDGPNPGDYDRLELLSQGGMQLGGELVLLFNNYVPSYGDSWQIIDGTQFSGSFEDLTSNIELVDGAVFKLVRNTGGLRLMATCPGDVNGDFSVNFLDIAQFIGHFQSQFESTDLNNDGLFNFLDISLFMSQVAESCG